MSAVEYHYSANASAAAAAQHAMGYRNSPRGSLRDSDHDEKRLSEISTNTTTSSSSTTTATSKRSKSHVGPWRLGRTLGKGSSGRVRLAKHSVTGQLAAVKIVPKAAVAQSHHQNNNNAPTQQPQNMSSADSESGGLPYGIEREVVIMKLIDHPNVMALYDVWENKGELYLVLEYIEGGELFDYLIRKGRLEEKEAIHYFRQIIYGIDYCHRFNICHRDLKPENLLLDKHRNIKIADFGMAALETKGNMLETSCGSPHYASPEIVSGKHYHGAPSDIWSCGIILFALLTGHLPFDDDSIRKLLLKVQAGNFVMPKYLSLEAKDLIWRMLRVDPDQRITMPDILRHPLLTKYPVPSALKKQWEKYNNNQLTTFSSSLDTVRGIDMEIVKSLQILWHGASKEQIIRSLLLPEQNAEKTFYCLLLKYRHDHGSVDPISAPIGGQNNSNPQASYGSNTAHTSHHGSSQVVKKQLNVRKGSHTRSGSVTSHKRNVSFVSVTKKSHTHSRQHSQASQTSLHKSTSNASPSSMSLEDQHKDRAVHIATGSKVSTPAVDSIRTGSAKTGPLLHAPVVSSRAVSAPTTSSSMGNSYILPMIFEEDRFADAIEEEFDLKVLHKKPSANRGVNKSSVSKSTSKSTGRSTNKSVRRATKEMGGSEQNIDIDLDFDTPQPLPNEGDKENAASQTEHNHKHHDDKQPEYIQGFATSTPPRPTRRPVQNAIHVAKRPLPVKPFKPVDHGYPSSGIAMSSEDSFRTRSHTGFNVYNNRTSSREVEMETEKKPEGHKQLQQRDTRTAQAHTTQAHATEAPRATTQAHTTTVPKDSSGSRESKKSAEYARVKANTTQPETVLMDSSANIPTSRKPLSTRDPNAGFRVTAMLNGKEMSTNIRSSYYLANENEIPPPLPDLVKKPRNSSRGAASFLRKLTLTPKRPPPPKPSPEQDSVKPWRTNTNANANANTNANNGMTGPGNNGNNSEIKQSWFMKLFNPQPTSTSGASGSGSGDNVQRRKSFTQRRKKQVTQQQAEPVLAMNSSQPVHQNTKNTSVKQVSVSGGAATRQMFFNMTPTRARHLLVEILEEWQKYGIQDIVENSATSSITAVISSDNVLGIRKAAFKVSVYEPRPSEKATALFIQDSGSVNSFLRFADALENMLRSMGALSS